MRIVPLILLFLAFFAVFGSQPSAANDLSVNSLRIGNNPDSTRVVLELSRKADFRAFLLQNPSRLVIDLPAFAWKANTPAPQPGSLVGAIRNGELQPGVSRIVIDLQKPAILKSAFFLPSGPNISDRVVMDLTPAPPGYNASNDRMFGTLSTQTPAGAFVPPVKTEEQVLKAPAQAKEAEAQETPYTPPPSPFKGPSRGVKPLIVIDPGHGGDDPGAIGANGKREKDVTLATAKELAQQLESSGRYRVHLTRSTDIFIKLQDRVGIARKKGADLFISLHADSIDKPNVSGASIYTLSNKASDAQTAKLAARENRADLIAGVDLSHEDKEVANILIDLAMRDTMNQSKFFANTVVKQATRQGIGMLEKPHRFAGFAVLKAPDIPSVLLEMGFMSNKREVSQLSSPEYRRKVAASVLAGIDAYFSKVQKSGQD